MKVLVIEPFIDKYTNKFHWAGETLEYSAERAQELQDNGFVKLEDEQKPKGRKKAKKA